MVWTFSPRSAHFLCGLLCNLLHLMIGTLCLEPNVNLYWGRNKFVSLVVTNSRSSLICIISRRVSVESVYCTAIYCTKCFQREPARTFFFIFFTVLQMVMSDSRHSNKRQDGKTDHEGWITSATAQKSMGDSELLSWFRVLPLFTTVSCALTRVRTVLLASMYKGCAFIFVQHKKLPAHWIFGWHGMFGCRSNAINYLPKSYLLFWRPTVRQGRKKRSSTNWLCFVEFHQTS